MTLDASMWTGAVGELSSCVINTIPLDHNIRNTFRTNLPIDFLSFFCFMYLYIYMFIFLMYCNLHAVLIQHIY